MYSSGRKEDTVHCRPKQRIKRTKNTQINATVALKNSGGKKKLHKEKTNTQHELKNRNHKIPITQNVQK